MVGRPAKRGTRPLGTAACNSHLTPRTGRLRAAVFGGSDSAALSLKGGYALQWWIIRWLLPQGVRWYDLGGEAQEQGLRQFKKGLVGKRGIVVTIDEYDHWTQPSAGLLSDAMYALRGLQRIIRSRCYGT